MDKKFKYTVFTRCFTYNHALYIEETLNGFAMQETNFPVVFCIVDDASNDGEQEVLLRWAQDNLKISGELWNNKDFGRSIVACHKEKDNLLFVILLLSENHYGKKAKWPYYLEWSIESKYNAICEGDDYWTSPHKLQLQVDFMESHPEHSLCFHANTMLFNNSKEKNYNPYDENKDECPMKDMIIGGGGFMATNSMLYVGSLSENMPAWSKKSPVGDCPLMLVLAVRGKVGYINEIMSCYRIAIESSWTMRQRKSRKNRKENYKRSIDTWKEFDKWTNYKYHKIIKSKIRKNSLHFWLKELFFMNKIMILMKK